MKFSSPPRNHRLGFPPGRFCSQRNEILDIDESRRQRSLPICQSVPGDRPDVNVHYRQVSEMKKQNHSVMVPLLIDLRM